MQVLHVVHQRSIVSARDADQLRNEVFRFAAVEVVGPHERGGAPDVV
ncbi:unannotated protein [freshwater metagenome]|uniref:Unannotated protein n=1 Tax=freshwater metagenome TaxID=449393 RepID=A0A6J6KT85_9ZZZZ